MDGVGGEERVLEWCFGVGLGGATERGRREREERKETRAAFFPLPPAQPAPSQLFSMLLFFSSRHLVHFEPFYVFAFPLSFLAGVDATSPIVSKKEK